MPALTTEAELEPYLSARARAPQRRKRLGSPVARSSAWVFPLLWLFIGTVSCYDAYLILKYQQSLLVMELNPVGCWLMQADNGEPSLFLAAKFQGTIVVLGALQLIHRWNAGLGHVMAVSLAVFQAGLLAFLTLSVPSL
jgi:hypothetical protein